MERFSRLEEAVEAVDYEVGKRGRAAAGSARPNAAWRHEPIPPELAKRLAALDPPRSATTRGAALGELVYVTHGPRRRRMARGPRVSRP